MNYKGEPIPKVRLGSVAAPVGSKPRRWISNLALHVPWGKGAPRLQGSYCMCTSFLAFLFFFVSHILR